MVDFPLAGYQAAIFDMDGTMVDNMVYHQKAWQEFLRRYGLSFTDEEFKRKISGKKNDQICELAFGERLTREQKLAYAEEKEALYRELFSPDIKEIDGLSRTVADLHARGLKTAIATTAPAKNRQFVLHALALEDHFEVILGDEHVTRGKPHPEIYRAAANALTVSPEKCLVFEDSPPGIASAKNAGMTVIGILSSHSAEELADADYLATDFTDISFF